MLNKISLANSKGSRLPLESYRYEIDLRIQQANWLKLDSQTKRPKKAPNYSLAS
jgi:hypothetical protein